MTPAVGIRHSSGHDLVGHFHARRKLAVFGRHRREVTIGETVLFGVCWMNTKAWHPSWGHQAREIVKPRVVRTEFAQADKTQRKRLILLMSRHGVHLVEDQRLVEVYLAVLMKDPLVDPMGLKF